MLACPDVSYKPFLDLSLFTSPKLSLFTFLLTHYTPAMLTGFHFPKPATFSTLAGRLFPLLSLPGYLKILFHVICADTAAFQKPVQTAWVPSSVIPQVLTFPYRWLPALNLCIVPGRELLEGEGSVPITDDLLSRFVTSSASSELCNLLSYSLLYLCVSGHL